MPVSQAWTMPHTSLAQDTSKAPADCQSRFARDPFVCTDMLKSATCRPGCNTSQVWFVRSLDLWVALRSGANSKPLPNVQGSFRAWCDALPEVEFCDGVRHPKSLYSFGCTTNTKCGATECTLYRKLIISRIFKNLSSTAPMIWLAFDSREA